jgi:hypothetical protein
LANYQQNLQWAAENFGIAPENTLLPESYGEGFDKVYLHDSIGIHRDAGAGTGSKNGWTITNNDQSLSDFTSAQSQLTYFIEDGRSDAEIADAWQQYNAAAVAAGIDPSTLASGKAIVGVISTKPIEKPQSADSSSSQQGYSGVEFGVRATLGGLYGGVEFVADAVWGLGETLWNTGGLAVNTLSGGRYATQQADDFFHTGESGLEAISHPVDNIIAPWYRTTMDAYNRGDAYAYGRGAIRASASIVTTVEGGASVVRSTANAARRFIPRTAVEGLAPKLSPYGTTTVQEEIAAIRAQAQRSSTTRTLDQKISQKVARTSNELATSPSNGLPDWLKARFEAGNEFNRVNRAKYPYNEVEVIDGSGNKFRVDSYDPVSGEIVSRKLTQLSEVKLSTGISYLKELAKKYPKGASISDSVFNAKILRGQRLDGDLVLEVPVQNKPIPKAVLDYASKNSMIIRDINGVVY